MVRQAPLTGFTDKENPKWRENLLGMTAEPASRLGRRNRRTGRISAFVDPKFIVLMHNAADQRGIAYAAYIRRAITAFVAHDLGLKPEEVAQYAPKALPTGGFYTPIGQEVPKTADDMQGFGSWDVCEG